jgi:4-carboxymuconolactone decarboxylase
MSRQQRYEPAKLDLAQRKVFDRLLTSQHFGSDGFFHGPHDPWLLNGELAGRLESLGDVIREGLSIDRSLIELAVLSTARFWESNFEWAGHSLAAARCGVAESVIDSILANERPRGAPDQVLIYDICRSLQTQRAISGELYASAIEMLGERGLVEIIATVGFYTLVCMTVSAFDCEVRPGVNAPFKRKVL